VQVFSQDSSVNFKPQNFKNYRFAHRGGYANGPENTIVTILNSLKGGAKAIEVDVALTKDNQLVLFHDKKINRILKTDLNIEISEIELKELQKIPLRNTSLGKQYVNSLKELVDTLAVFIPKNRIENFVLELDFKPYGKKTKIAVNELHRIIKNKVASFGDTLYNYFFVSTFYPEVLKELKKVDPKIVKAYIVHNSPDDKKLLAKIAILLAPRFVRKYDVEIIEPNICMIDKRFVKKWKKRGKLINAYTANTNCEKEYVENFQIAYTTDCPDGSCKRDTYGKQTNWCKNCE
jgi:glycerophosphoryl diester phosphodiesterase